MKPGNKYIYAAENIHVSVYHLMDTLTTIIDKLVPTKKIQLRKQYVEWLSTETLEFTVDRDKSRKQADNTGLEEHWTQYKRLQNLCVRKNHLDHNWIIR